MRIVRLGRTQMCTPLLPLSCGVCPFWRYLGDRADEVGVQLASCPPVAFCALCLLLAGFIFQWVVTCLWAGCCLDWNKLALETFSSCLSDTCWSLLGLGAGRVLFSPLGMGWAGWAGSGGSLCASGLVSTIPLGDIGAGLLSGPESWLMLQARWGQWDVLLGVWKVSKLILI